MPKFSWKRMSMVALAAMFGMYGPSFAQDVPDRPFGPVQDEAQGVVYNPLAVTSGKLMSYRHYWGRRYLAPEYLDVFRAPARDQRIIGEIAPFRMFYASPTHDPDWLEVHGAGIDEFIPRYDRPYVPDVPLSLSADGIHEPERAGTGRFHIDDETHHGEYIPMLGYVMTNRVFDAEMDRSPPIPGLVDSPQFWDDLGILDARKIATDVSVPPLSSLVYVYHVPPEGEGFACSGFFAEDILTVVSAGHCKSESDGQYAVDIVRPGFSELILAEKLASSPSGRYFNPDWLILRLERSPTEAVNPLSLHDGSAFSGKALVEIIAAGYPADNRGAARDVAGFDAPSLSYCSGYVPDMSLDPTREQLLVQTANCTVGKGQSGGPFLVWNSNTGAYEYIGTVFGTVAKAVLPELLDDEAVRIIHTRAAQLLGMDADDEDFLTSWPLVPGSAAIDNAIKNPDGTSARFDVGTLSTAFLAALGEATGKAIPQVFFPALEGQSLFDHLLLAHETEEYDPPLDPIVLRGLQRACFYYCNRDHLDPTYQIDLKRGNAWPDEELRRVPHLKITEDQIWFEDGLAHNDDTSYVIVGGDAFALKYEGRIIENIARRIVNVMEDDDELIETTAAKAADALDCEEAPQSAMKSISYDDEAPLRNESSTPPVIAGVINISGSDLICIFEHSDTFVHFIDLAGDLLTVPGAIDGTDIHDLLNNDENSRLRLATWLSDRGIVAPNDPVVVYCGQYDCRDGAVLSRRLVEFDYDNVYWMRGGMAKFVIDMIPLPFFDETVIRQ